MDILYVYIKNKVILERYNELAVELKNVFEFKFFNSIDSLKNEVLIKQNQTICLIDIEDEIYKLTTNNFFTSNKNVKFVGIGFRKNIDQIIELFNNNITAFINIQNKFIDLIKAVEKVKDSKYFVCDTIKDEVVDKYLELYVDIKKDIAYEKILNNIFNNTSNTSNTNNNNNIFITEKEKKVLDFLIQGLSYKEIAALLNISTFSVNQKASSIYKKLNVKSRSELSFKVLN